MMPDNVPASVADPAASRTKHEPEDPRISAFCSKTFPTSFMPLLTAATSGRPIRSTSSRSIPAPGNGSIAR